MKVFNISKFKVLEAYVDKGSAGVDNVDIETYDKHLKDNLYRLWNRMCSGSNFPKPVKLVEIPKSDGGKRSLGIPTLEDRVGQVVVVQEIQERIESIFHDDSYGYRLTGPPIKL